MADDCRCGSIYWKIVLRKCNGDLVSSPAFLTCFPHFLVSHLKWIKSPESLKVSTCGPNSNLKITSRGRFIDLCLGLLLAGKFQADRAMDLTISGSSIDRHLDVVSSEMIQVRNDITKIGGHRIILIFNNNNFHGFSRICKVAKHSDFDSATL